MAAPSLKDRQVLWRLLELEGVADSNVNTFVDEVFDAMERKNIASFQDLVDKLKGTSYCYVIRLPIRISPRFYA